MKLNEEQPKANRDYSKKPGKIASSASAAGLRELLELRRNVASIRDARQLEAALTFSDTLSCVFILTGNIGVIKSYVDLFKQHGIPVFVHVEKIGGLSFDQPGLEYFANAIKPDGIITTKTQVVRKAQKLGLTTIQRFFLIDSEGLANITQSLEQVQPDVIEIMPARIPEVLGKVRDMIKLPIISGGLLTQRKQAEECLANGATAISSSSPALWKESFDLTQV
ncbi:glycerol-3-phosphate responsive antiterminator [Paenibacillus sp. JCM 10914]|uniref:glycerol-3-phosphate responsive antiterminator n=1 Tax=Paenibacillus sp. JCM 10914 TaxID=1236974 RepID=UPI0003CC4F56|nr:glycerol-3-phosphate responsive antiterminator [Paenibacillus sp. JCM 10914]GAE06482.1 glycerol uptake operon antiterminator regulatory protein [Paenibacillus sp. JCM 10914]